VKGINLYPSRPTHFKSLYESYVAQLLALGKSVMRAMGEAIGSPDPDVFVKATSESFWVMRAIGYPALLPGGLGVSCGEHTDYGCTTFLLADDTPNALQVLSKTGEWLTANPLPHAFVVNIGDMMEVWTNGLWKSTVHRVIHTGTQYRVSVPFFLEPGFETFVEPLECCVEGPGGVSDYEGVVYGKHLVSKISGNFYSGGSGQ